MIIYYYLFWLFAYSFLGWIYESSLCSITGKKFVNRGFLNGPICPVYGCGAVVVIFFLSPLKNPISIFLAGMILTCAVEYITSWLLETIFHARWWDYSQYKFNINGRVCLLGATVFGGFSVVLLEWIHPFVQIITLKIATPILIGLVALFMCIGIGDCIITVTHILRLNGKLEEIQDSMNEFLQESYSKAKDLKETLYESFEASKFYNERVKELIESVNIQEHRLLNAFPQLRSINYNEALEQLRAKRESGLKKLKEFRDKKKSEIDKTFKG